MPAYQLVLPYVAAQLYGGVNILNVFAADANAAKVLANAKFGQDAAGIWDNATVTEIATAADLEDWTFSMRIYDPALGPDDESTIEVSVTAVDTDDIDDVGGDLVTALNGTDAISGAAYNTGTNVLTIAETTDGIGDWHVDIYASAPAALGFDPGVNLAPMFHGTITHEGSTGAALAVTLVTSAPAVYAYGRKVD